MASRQQGIVHVSQGARAPSVEGRILRQSNGEARPRPLTADHHERSRFQDSPAGRPASMGNWASTSTKLIGGLGERRWPA
ncbi:hypothetical protein S40293_11183, partial [Stachybotrys chartarum IBT 40293]